MYTLKYKILLKYLKKIYCKYTTPTLKLHVAFIFWNFYTKIKCKKKCIKLQQNIVCLKQQIYASPENCIHSLHVMHVTFRRSAFRRGIVSLTNDKKKGFNSFMGTLSQIINVFLSSLLILAYHCPYPPVSTDYPPLGGSGCFPVGCIFLLEETWLLHLLLLLLS